MAKAEFCSTFGGPDDFMCINHRYDCHDEPVKIDFGGWEGTVNTINDQGEVVDIDVPLSAWRDSSGTVTESQRIDGAGSTVRNARVLSMTDSAKTMIIIRLSMRPDCR